MRFNSLGVSIVGQQFTLQIIGEIVHVELKSCFVISLGHLMPLWAEVLAACHGKALRRVLIEGTSPARDMEPLDAYAHGDFLGGVGRPGLRVAFCLYGYEPDALTQHFLRLCNSGTSAVRFFDDIDSAILWVGM